MQPAGQQWLCGMRSLPPLTPSQGGPIFFIYSAGLLANIQLVSNHYTFFTFCMLHCDANQSH